MTRDSYLLLSPHDQEAFINDGGVIDFEQQVVILVEPNPLPTPVAVHSVVCDIPTQPAVLPISPVVSNEVPGPSIGQDISITQEKPFGSEPLDGYDIDNPVTLLFLLDDDISSGRVKLHEWQIKIMLDFAESQWNDSNPFQAIVRACNGSGKDKYVIAPCAVWLCMRYKKSICPVTSSSGVQLDRQTCRYVTTLCDAANRKFPIQMWTVNYRHYTCNFEGKDDKSEIFCFATDEKGKAEGYHPNVYNSKMGIFVSEDKTVADDINDALNKCTGYTHRVHVSTPGDSFGHFYDYDSTAIPREELEQLVKDHRPMDWIRYHIPSTKCTHLSRAYIDQMAEKLPGGRFGPAYKSQVDAEFCHDSEMVAIPGHFVRWATKNIPLNGQPDGWLRETYNTGGLDLSDGGDETVLIIRNGNKVIKIIPFRFDNTEDTIEFLQDAFRENGLTHKESLIFADCGGLGSPMLKSLKRKGWTNIRFVDNRNRPSEPLVYKNRGSELYFHTRKLFERHELIIPNDNLLIKQLSTRYYKLNGGSIHQLLSKLESRSRGFPSPDRADAFVLAFWNYKSTYVEKDEEANLEGKEDKDVETIVGDMSLKAWATNKQRKWQPEQQSNFAGIEDEISEYNKQLSNRRN